MASRIEDPAGIGLDPLLAAVARAPVVPLTDEERAALAEIDEPERWLSTADVMAHLPKPPVAP